MNLLRPAVALFVLTGISATAAHAQEWRRVTPASCAAADSVFGALPRRLETKIEAYENRFRASSGFRSEPYSAGGGHLSLRGNMRLPLQVWFQHTETQGGPARYFMMFVQNSPEWQYLRDRQLNLIIDGSERIALGQASRQGEVNTSGRSVRVVEVLSAPLTPEQATRIARATRVEGELGPTQFALNPKHHEGLVSVMRMVSCSTPAAPAQP